MRRCFVDLAVPFRNVFAQGLSLRLYMSIRCRAYKTFVLESTLTLFLLARPIPHHSKDGERHRQRG